MKRHTFLLLTVSALFMACSTPEQDVSETTATEEMNNTPTFQNTGHELVYNMVEKVGFYDDWKSKKDVVYTYTYTTPDSSTDQSTEQYIFEGELSYGHYHQHQRTLPELEGPIVQGYDGEQYWLSNNDTMVTDEAALKPVAFSRPTNFYWFAMLPKLLDPGVTYEHLGAETHHGSNYDVVKVSFESPDGTPKDIYQLYINQETQLMDQFLFTVADFGLMDTPLLMQVEYEEVDGLLIPTKRRYKMSTWEANVDDAPWTMVSWTDIVFGNDLSPSDFKAG